MFKLRPNSGTQIKRSHEHEGENFEFIKFDVFLSPGSFLRINIKVIPSLYNSLDK